MRRISRQHSKKSSFWRFFLCTAVFVPVFFSWSLFQDSDRASFSLSASPTRDERTRDRGIIFDRDLRVLARDKEKPAAGPGREETSTFERTYPHGRLASHLIGFSRDNAGLAGLEFSFDPALSGHYFPESLPETDIFFPPASGRHGFHLITTLNLTAQKHLENVLAPQRDTDGSIAISGALLHIDSGEILALSSMPAFNPNRFWNDSATLHVNHFLQDTLPLGAYADIICRTVMRQQADTAGEKTKDTDTLSAEVMTRFAATRLGLDRHLLPELTRRHFFTPTQLTGLLHLARTRVTPLELLTIAASLAAGRPVTPRLTAALVDRENGRVLKPRLQRHQSPPTPLPKPQKLPWILSTRQQDSTSATEGQEDATGCATTGLFTMDGDLYLALIVATGLPASQAHAMTENKMEHFVASIRTATRLRPPLPLELPVVAASSLPGNSRPAVTKRQASRQDLSASVKTAMPQVTGLSLREGLARLSGLALEIAIQGNGTIVSQLPAPGAQIAGRTRCRLTLATAMPESSVTGEP